VAKSKDVSNIIPCIAEILDLGRGSCAINFPGLGPLIDLLKSKAVSRMKLSTYHPSAVRLANKLDDYPIALENHTPHY
jgi:hypothetical protein